MSPMQFDNTPYGCLCGGGMFVFQSEEIIYAQQQISDV